MFQVGGDMEELDLGEAHETVSGSPVIELEGDACVGTPGVGVA